MIKTQENSMAKSILHTSESRGTSNWGWLHSRHSFSFGDYYDPNRTNFGALRVINDDFIAPGKGFGNHPHSNMEIITIPLEGELEHTDSLNNSMTMKSGEIQVMSAGTGIFHSEYNKLKDQSLKFLQIWIIPKVKNVTPRYDIQKYNLKENELTEILSPNLDSEKVWINQNAWFNIAKLEANCNIKYKLHDAEKNGVYIFVIKGSLWINNQELKARDGFGIWEITELELIAISITEVLLMEVPMNI